MVLGGVVRRMPQGVSRESVNVLGLPISAFPCSFFSFVSFFWSLALTLRPRESQATPGTEEEWKAFTDRLPGEIKLRRYKAGRRAPRIVELTELTDALGQALAYCLHLDENFELDKAIDAASMHPNCLPRPLLRSSMWLLKPTGPVALFLT